MTLRGAVPSDAQALADIHAACFDVAWSSATIWEFIDAGDVTLCGHPPTGFVIIKRVLDEAEIITIAIDPAARRQGVGRILLAQKLADLVAHGVERVFLEVAADNDAAQNLYKALGFAQIGTRKGYYNRQKSPDIDALVLSLTLDARDKNTHISTK